MLESCEGKDVGAVLCFAWPASSTRCVPGGVGIAGLWILTPTLMAAWGPLPWIAQIRNACRQQCWCSAVLPLACLFPAHCLWTCRLCGSLDPTPKHKCSVGLQLKPPVSLVVQIRNLWKKEYCASLVCPFQVQHLWSCRLCSFLNPNLKAAWGCCLSVFIQPKPESKKFPLHRSNWQSP